MALLLEVGLLLAAIIGGNFFTQNAVMTSVPKFLTTNARIAVCKAFFSHVVPPEFYSLWMEFSLL